MRKPMTTGSTGSEKMFFTTDEAFNAGWRSEFVKLGAPTTIRLYPHFIGNTPQDQLVFEDGAAGEDLIGEFIAPYATITQFGPNKVSGVVELRDAIPGVAHPINVMHERLEALSKCDATLLNEQDLKLYRIVREWAFAYAGRSDTRPSIRLPETSLFMRGCCTILRGEVPQNYMTKALEPQHKTLLRVGKSAMDDMVSKLTTALDTSQPFSVENSVLGDLVGPNGCSIKITDKKEARDTGISISVYTVEKDKPVPLPTEVVFTTIYDNGKYSNWDRLIYRPTVVEMIEKLRIACGSQAVEYAFRDHPVYAPYVTRVEPITVHQSVTSHAAPNAQSVPKEEVKPIQQAPAEHTTHPMYQTLKSTGMSEMAIVAAIAAMDAPKTEEEQAAESIPGLESTPAPTPAPAPTPTPEPAPAPAATGKEPTLAELAAQMSAAQAQFEASQAEE